MNPSNQPPASAPALSRIVDWRDVDAGTSDRCDARERRYWHDALSWDSDWTWAVVEEARRSRVLPGFVALDDAGAVAGWSFHLLDRLTLRIGGLVAADPLITNQLVDATVAAARSTGAQAVACFITSRAVGLRDALTSRGASAEAFHYLASPLTAVAGSGPAGPEPARGLIPERWDGDLDAAAGLLAGAYAPGAAIHFANDGTRDDWGRYVRQLVEQHGCGTIDRRATSMMRDSRGLAALALITSLAPTTAHVAQIAVRHDRRGERLAERLLVAAGASAHGEGRTLLTLLVGEGNHAARRLYQRLGFVARAEFVAARLTL